jgi:hypothetical protein
MGEYRTCEAPIDVMLGPLNRLIRVQLLLYEILQSRCRRKVIILLQRKEQ